MRKLLLTLLALLLPLSVGAQKITDFDNHPSAAIPLQFSSSSETSVMEWGCPVSEVVEADSQVEALQIIGKECVEEAKRAANAKPEVFEVIEASVIWPDVSISEEGNGYRLSGTFFLETLVLQGAKGWDSNE